MRVAIPIVNDRFLLHRLLRGGERDHDLTRLVLRRGQDGQFECIQTAPRIAIGDGGEVTPCLRIKSCVHAAEAAF